jgi:hypothetical protein
MIAREIHGIVIWYAGAVVADFSHRALNWGLHREISVCSLFSTHVSHSSVVLVPPIHHHLSGTVQDDRTVLAHKLVL